MKPDIFDFIEKHDLNDAIREKVWLHDKVKQLLYVLFLWFSYSVVIVM
jgi:hypothetical protein